MRTSLRSAIMMVVSCALFVTVCAASGRLVCADENPVRQSAGIVGFSAQAGLEVVELSIYDPTGSLVHRTNYPSLGGVGGTFGTWDLRNLQGRSVGAGTYLVVVKTIDQRGQHRGRRFKLGIRN